MGKQVLEYNIYPKKNKLTNEEKQQLELNAYANFCVDYVNMLKKALNLTIAEKETTVSAQIVEGEIKEEIYITKVYSIDMPKLSKNIKKESVTKITKAPTPINSQTGGV